MGQAYFHVYNDSFVPFLGFNLFFMHWDQRETDHASSKEKN